MQFVHVYLLLVGETVQDKISSAVCLHSDGGVFAGITAILSGLSTKHPSSTYVTHVEYGLLYSYSMGYLEVYIITRTIN